LTSLQDLKTLLAENMNLKCIIFNDQNPKLKSLMKKSDIQFTEIAKAFGIEGNSIEFPKDLIPAFKKMFNHDGPYVLEVKCHYE
jgi:thiamine pyrophosphate-dependent acetolactate synthase large subunit-like protein